MHSTNGEDVVGDDMLEHEVSRGNLPQPNILTKQVVY